MKAQPWSTRTPAGTQTLTRRGAEILRNGWATEVILNSPRVLGGDELIAFANLWAPVQAYYSAFEAFTAFAMTTSSSSPPRTYAALLNWASSNVGHPLTPFVTPWTARVAVAGTSSRTPVNCGSSSRSRGSRCRKATSPQSRFASGTSELAQGGETIRQHDALIRSRGFTWWAWWRKAR